MITLSPAVRETLGRAHVVPGTTVFDTLPLEGKFLVVLNATAQRTGAPLYAGAVPFAEKVRRRAANRVARRSRRLNRGR